MIRLTPGGIRILAATIQNLAAGTYWVLQNGTLSASTVAPPDIYNGTGYDIVKVYISHAVETGFAGSNLNIAEIWPTLTTGGVAGYPPNVTVNGVVVQVDTVPLAATAENLVWTVDQYISPTVGNKGTAFSLGAFGLRITATTFPTAASDIFIELFGRPRSAGAVM